MSMIAYSGTYTSIDAESDAVVWYNLRKFYPTIVIDDSYETETAEELAYILRTNGHSSYVIAENSASAADVLLSRPGVTSGGYMICTTNFIAIAYLKGSKAFTLVKTSSDVVCYADWTILSPNSYISTDACEILAAQSSSYCCIGDGVVQSFEDVIAPCLPNFSKALLYNKEPIAIYGLQTGHLGIDYLPTSTFGGLVRFLTTNLDTLSSLSTGSDYGIVLTTGNVAAAQLTKFRAGSSVDVSAFCRIYSAPASDALSNPFLFGVVEYVTEWRDSPLCVTISNSSQTDLVGFTEIFNEADYDDIPVNVYTFDESSEVQQVVDQYASKYSEYLANYVSAASDKVQAFFKSVSEEIKRQLTSVAALASYDLDLNQNRSAEFLSTYQTGHTTKINFLASPEIDYDFSANTFDEDTDADTLISNLSDDLQKIGKIFSFVETDTDDGGIDFEYDSSAIENIIGTYVGDLLGFTISYDDDNGETTTVTTSLDSSVADESAINVSSDSLGQLLYNLYTAILNPYNTVTELGFTGAGDISTRYKDEYSHIGTDCHGYTGHWYKERLRHSADWNFYSSDDEGDTGVLWTSILSYRTFVGKASTVSDSLYTCDGIQNSEIYDPEAFISKVNITSIKSNYNAANDATTSYTFGGTIILQLNPFNLKSPLWSDDDRRSLTKAFLKGICENLFTNDGDSYTISVSQTGSTDYLYESYYDNTRIVDDRFRKLVGCSHSHWCSYTGDSDWDHLELAGPIAMTIRFIKTFNGAGSLDFSSTTDLNGNSISTYINKWYAGLTTAANDLAVSWLVTELSKFDLSTIMLVGERSDGNDELIPLDNILSLSAATNSTTSLQALYDAFYAVANSTDADGNLIYSRSSSGSALTQYNNLQSMLSTLSTLIADVNDGASYIWFKDSLPSTTGTYEPELLGFYWVYA